MPKGRENEKKIRRKINEEKMKLEEMMRKRKAKKKKKKKKGEKVHRGSNEKKKERKRKGKKRKKREDFPALRRSKLDSPSTKVDTVWIPKTWSFDKLYKVENFPTRFTLRLKAL